MDIQLTVNGTPRQLTVEAHWLLADVLRDGAGCTGVHLGCEYGSCGACTILLDGVPVRSCLTLAVQADGHDVTTVEGLATSARLSPVQDAFSAHHGLQCGFCTPGFLITASYVVAHYPKLSRAQIRELLSGNLCRCTGYHQIVNAVEEAMIRAESGTGAGARG